MYTYLINHAILSIFFVLMASAHAKLTLECDYTNWANKRQKMHYHLNVTNYISPDKTVENGPVHRQAVNIVRPLGGEKGSEKPETCKLVNGKYVYNWPHLIDQIDYAEKNRVLYSINIDNPPWAFSDVSRTSAEQYGNAWPINNNSEWVKFIKAMARELVKVYGQEKAENWRYTIGREVGHSGHWQGTEHEFFDHYKRTTEALHDVLPKAKVGVHFLSNNKYGTAFVKWCKQNSVHYDYLALSYYVRWEDPNKTDVELYYKRTIAPMTEIPEWNPNAKIEFHEHKVIEGFTSNPGTIPAPEDHRNAMTVAVAKMVYEKQMGNVYLWTNGANEEAPKAFYDWSGSDYYTSIKKGSLVNEKSMVDAIFSRTASEKKYNIIAYNYYQDPQESKTEALILTAHIWAPPGIDFKYREALYQKSDNSIQWSSWKTGKTGTSTSEHGSTVTFEIELPSFSYVKYEIVPETEVVSVSHPIRVPNSQSYFDSRHLATMKIFSLDGRVLGIYGELPGALPSGRFFAK